MNLDEFRALICSKCKKRFEDIFVQVFLSPPHSPIACKKGGKHKWKNAKKEK